jgi:hypothetical protein
LLSGDTVGRTTGTAFPAGSPPAGAVSAGVDAGGTGDSVGVDTAGGETAGWPAGFEARPGIGWGSVVGEVGPGPAVVFGAVVVMSVAGAWTTPPTGGDDNGVLLVIRAPSSSGKTVGNGVVSGTIAGCAVEALGSVITSGNSESSADAGGVAGVGSRFRRG